MGYNGFRQKNAAPFGAAYEDYLFGDISKTAFEEYQCMADFTMLHDVDDPEPEKHFQREMQRKKIKRRLKKFAAVRKIRQWVGR